VPIRARKAELSLIGNKIDEHFIDEAVRIAAEEINPNPGISLRASASYRREMVRILGRNVLNDAFIMASNS
jgi:CO/xanthine dehydrogenase FAD-binding subunit